MGVALGVLVSGTGTNLTAITDAISEGRLDATVKVVISNKPDAPALDRAKEAGIETVTISHRDYADREAFDAALVAALRAHDVAWVVLAGFMRVLTRTMLSSFPNRIVNIHPALLPAFPGVDAQRQAFDYGVKIAGCTVHLVDEGTDTGPILLQRAVPVLDSDDADSLRQRILVEEHRLLVEALRAIADERVEIVVGSDGRRTRARDQTGMTNRHYDAVILGRSVGALAAATLLARRDFRVLVLGQGQKPASYRFEGRTLRRRSFTFLAASCPSFRRMLHELAQTQTFRRKMRALDPMFGVLGDGFRLEIPPNLELFAREVDREFPEVRQVVDEMYGLFANANASGDAAFDRDAVWPPGTLWERFETSRAAAGLPFGVSDADELLRKFPVGHPYRDVTVVPAHFASDLAPTQNPIAAFALARLHGSWTRGVQALAGGADELEEFFVERIRAHGGECRLDQRATQVVVRGKAIGGVLEDGQETPTSTDSLLIDLPGEALAELSQGEGISKSAVRDWPRLTAVAGRFIVSLVVRTKGLPVSLPEESFLLPRKSARPDPRRLVVHLERSGVSDEQHADETLVVAEAIVPKRGALTLLEARESVLATLYEQLPYLERHVVLVDSPHDGLPLYDFRSGARREIDRIHVTETTPGPEPMQWMWSVEPQGYLGLGGEPVRGPIPGSYLVGSTVLPALGQEGQLLAGLSAARLVTRKDRSREKLRREMWTKIETG